MAEFNSANLQRDFRDSRLQSFESQIEAIDYFMGRSTQLPPFLLELHRRKPMLKLDDQARELRLYLSGQTDLPRIAFLNAIFQTPDSQISKAENLDQLLNHLTVGIKQE
ncbi:MAG: hypothetical protein KDD22_07895, partial [Bdellovibrionales bacterium]|nr:hypothetical protein [Bdellovibrionales bacterium]